MTKTPGAVARPAGQAHETTSIFAYNVRLLLKGELSNGVSMGKRPSLQFYPGDWLKDPAVRFVSLAARGLWIDMLSIMFECDPKGRLSLCGKLMPVEHLARMVGGSTDEVSRLLTELAASGVYSVTEDGIIYSRRMVRDEAEREATKDRVRKFRKRQKKRLLPVTEMKHECTEVEEEKEEQRKRGAGKNLDPLSPEGLAEAFCLVTCCTAAAEKRRSFVRPKVADLLRRGIAAQEIAEYIHDPQRPRTQFLWQFLAHWPEKGGHSRSAGGGGDSRIAAPRGKYDGIGRQVGGGTPAPHGPAAADIPAAS